MLNKIYLVLLAIAVITMGFLTFYSYSWLNSIGSPEIAVENFNFYSNLGWSFLWISFLALIAYANILIFKEGRSLAIWISFVYFAIFITLQTFWLAPSFLSFQQANNLTDSNFTFTPLIGAMTVFVLAIAVFFNQFIVHRLRDKMVGEAETEEQLGEETE
jgi:hypothetical protein